MCWLSCSFSETSSIDINTHPCIEDNKGQLSIASTDNLAETEAVFFFCSLFSVSFLLFFPLVSSCFPGIWFLLVHQLFFQVIDHGCLPHHG
jgi:hypothetical protein